MPKSSSLLRARERLKTRGYIKTPDGWKPFCDLSSDELSSLPASDDFSIPRSFDISFFSFFIHVFAFVLFWSSLYFVFVVLSSSSSPFVSSLLVLFTVCFFLWLKYCWLFVSLFIVFSHYRFSNRFDSLKFIFDSIYLDSSLSLDCRKKKLLDYVEFSKLDYFFDGGILVISFVRPFSSLVAIFSFYMLPFYLIYYFSTRLSVIRYSFSIE